MEILNLKQGSQEWLNFKAGKFSGSEIHKIMGAKGLGQTGLTYIDKKVGETLTGKIQEISSPSMEWGTTFEPMAIEYYEKAFKVKIEFAGCFISDFSKEVIYSPDGFFRVENEGYTLLEFKCPKTYENHVLHLKFKNYLDLKASKPEYYWQILLGLLISDFEIAEFISFHPEFLKNKMKSIIIRRKNVENDLNLLKNRINEAIKLKSKILSEL